MYEQKDLRQLNERTNERNRQERKKRNGSTENIPRKSFFFLIVFASPKKNSKRERERVYRFQMTYDLLVRFIRPPTLMLLSVPFTQWNAAPFWWWRRKTKCEKIVTIANDTNKYDHQMLFIIINF